MKTTLIGLSFFLFTTSAYSQPEIIVDKSKQSYFVIENGKTIKTGRVSTGKAGHSTPTGKFSIHSKFFKVRSAKYNAMMKYTMLFKGSLYAIHQGVVPGYPASHGCVRVPEKDAIYLFSSLPIGTIVTIK